jgi:cellulose biosynthesis protein BcsQ
MALVCWSVKGGSGTSVVAATLAVLASRREPVVLADLAGEAPAVLGLREPEGPGISEWLGTADRDPAALARLAVSAAPGLQLLPTGRSSLPAQADAAPSLLTALAEVAPEAVVDLGVPATPLGQALIAAATTSLLVLRPCYLALRRALAVGLVPDGLVVIRERARALSARDLSEVLQAPIRAEIDLDPAVARAVDAGLLAARLPRSLARALEVAA